MTDDRHLRLETATTGSAVKNFSFDKVLLETASQEEVFSQIRPLLESSLNGFNTSVFTYGKTPIFEEYFFK